MWIRGSNSRKIHLIPIQITFKYLEFMTTTKKSVRTIDKIITPVNSKYGAPMGRSSVFPPIYSIIDTGTKYIVEPINKKSKRLFDCAVPMSGDGAYDKGGAYWGHGAQLRVTYTKDLSYIHFYRA